MRDLLVFALIFGSLPFAFRRPYFGLLAFSWLAYMRPQDLTWGPARFFRFSFFVAFAFYAGFFLFERKRFFARDIRNYLLVLLLVWIGLTIPLAYYHFPVQIGRYIELAKMITVALITTSLVTTEKRLRILLWTVAVSLGFYGIKGGLWGLLTGGRILQGPGGMIRDNNDFSLAMVMNLPILFYLGKSEKDSRIKAGLYGACFLTVVTVVIAMSRGGFLAMAAVFAYAVSKSRHKTLGIAAGLVAAILFILFMPQDYRERIETIRADPVDESARSRLLAWQTALVMGASHPILGVGFYNFIPTYFMFNPNPSLHRGNVVAHNTYLQLLAECGVPALALFLLLMASTWFLLSRVRRRMRGRSDLTRLVHYSHALQVSLFGFLVGATFLNRAHFDLTYHILAMAVAIRLIAEQRLQEGVDDAGRPVAVSHAVSARAKPFQHAAHRWPRPRPRDRVRIARSSQSKPQNPWMPDPDTTWPRKPLRPERSAPGGRGPWS